MLVLLSTCGAARCDVKFRNSRMKKERKEKKA
jgi:hypothetical protein